MCFWRTEWKENVGQNVSERRAADAGEWEVGTCDSRARGESLTRCCGAEASWLQGAGQLKCLFMSVGQRRPCSAATWKALDALMRPNYHVCLQDCEGSKQESEWTFTPPSSQIFTYFHSVIARLAALQTSATSKCRARRLVTVTACHACFIPCDGKLQNDLTWRNVGQCLRCTGHVAGRLQTFLKSQEIDAAVRKVWSAKEAGED